MNFYSGQARPGQVVLAPDGCTVKCESVSGFGTDVAIAVRPENVRVTPCAGAAPDTGGEVLRETPRGHYKELLVRLGENTVRAFVASDFSADRVAITFTRVLVYADGQLLHGDHQPGANGTPQRSESSDERSREEQGNQ